MKDIKRLDSELIHTVLMKYSEYVVFFPIKNNRTPSIEEQNNKISSIFKNELDEFSAEEKRSGLLTFARKGIDSLAESLSKEIQEMDLPGFETMLNELKDKCKPN
jgi:hypothetical protein